MAVFGPIQSPNPSVLFNPLAVDAQVQGMQRNRLLMQQAVEDRQVARMDREREEVGRVSASLLSLDPAARPAAYSAAVADLQRNGLARQAPAEYPGDGRIEQMARAAMPAQAQFALAEKAQARQDTNFLLAQIPGMAGMFGGNAAGGMTPGIAPPSAVAATAPPMGPRPSYAAGEEARSRLLDQPPEVLAQASAQRSTVPEMPGGYRANPGVAGQNAGLPPPTGTINPNVGGGAGLTPMQAAAVMMGARSNPGSLPGLLAGIGQQNAMAAERAADNARADAAQRMQFASSAQQMELARETAARQDALARRQEEAARRQAETSEMVPDGQGGLAPRPGGPRDPAVIRREAEARKVAETSTVSAADRTKLRNIETEAEGILGALDAFKDTRKQAGATERVASALGQPTALNSSYNNAALLAKGEALYNLGVLNGPDLDIIRRTLADPGTIRGAVAGQGTVDAQIDQIKGLLNQRLTTARRQYGGEGGGGERVRSEAANPQGTALPQPGAVEDGYRFKGGNPADPSSWERVR